jgi:glutamine synthetase adenylyltransferase
VQVEALRDDEMSAEERGELKQAARLFRAVDHAIRLVTGKSAPQLPSGAKLEAVAELAAQWLHEPLSGAVLTTRLSEVRQSVREIFNRVFG